MGLHETFRVSSEGALGFADFKRSPRVCGFRANLDIRLSGLTDSVRGSGGPRGVMTVGGIIPNKSPYRRDPYNPAYLHPAFSGLPRKHRFALTLKLAAAAPLVPGRSQTAVIPVELAVSYTNI